MLSPLAFYKIGIYICKAFFYRRVVSNKKEHHMTLSHQAVMRIYGRAAEHQITAGKLAAAAGLSRVTLSNWKCQRATPMLEAYLAVEQALEELIAAKTNGAV
jgi:transcriptional regulator with XRE-family HTH domain